jgi:hypothetical protein
MTELTKAKLTKLGPGDNPQEITPSIEVQFNPASMRLALSNETEGGRSRGRQERQFTGLSSTDLTFDLVFDTADEAVNGEPRSVREKTALVEQFVLAEPNSSDRNRRVVPPRVRFQWGDFHIDGIIKTLSIDFDLFAPDGTPLRAKMGVSIKEQNPRYELDQSEAGENASPDPEPSERSPAEPGGEGDGRTDRTGTALEGESAADFASRMGLDPAAWRAVAAGLDGTLSLQAGVEIDFSAGISLGAGLSAGVSVGASVSASLEASFGLEVGAAGSASAGFALSAAGGVSAAVETVASAKSEAAAETARNSFVAPPAPARDAPPIARPAMPDQPRAPLRAADAPSPVSAVRGGGAQSAPPPPLADPRATTYGFGVPLRPRISPAADQRSGAISGRVPVRPYARLNEVQVSNDPGAAPWTSLPAVDPTRTTPAAERTTCRCRGRCSCGCGGR